MNDVPAPPDDAARRAGLCGVCRHAKRVVSAKGSTFWLCERSRTEPAYRKYPPLPVLACPGHERGTPQT